jgi:hypothetical protein
MLTSPIVITIGAQAYSLKLKNQDNFGAVYMDNTTVAKTEVKLEIKHAYEGKPKTALSGTGYVSTQMERHVADLTVTTFDSNGFPTVIQTYDHIRNSRGAVPADVTNVAKGLSAFITAQAANLVAWDA